MRMRKHAAWLLVLLCLLPISTHAAGRGYKSWVKPAVPPLESIAVEALDATTLSVSWNDIEDAIVEITYGVEGQARTETVEAYETPFLLAALAPNTAYTVTVSEPEQAISLTETVTLPEPGPYRVHGYHWNLCNPYYVLDGDGDFFSRNRRRVNRETLDDFAEKWVDGSYAVILEATWEKTKEDKEWADLIVMRAPCGDVFTSYAADNVCDPTWTSIYSSYPLGPLLGDYSDAYGGIDAGEYLFEIYFEGEFAGRTKLELTE